MCKLTLETFDSTLQEYLIKNVPGAKVVVAKCIGCCGNCSDSYIVLADGKKILADSREALLALLVSP